MVSQDRYPEGLRYTREHEWIRVEGEEGVIGVTWFAQDQLGDVVFCEVPAVGSRLTKDEPFGVVESVKTVSDLYAPVSGQVVAVNEELESRPELVNEDPYGRGWIVRVRIENPAELDDLMDAEAYRAMVEGSD
ncbi:MAG: glycine cleavage system protein GcvH [Thermaerobacter sp.]|nr:glycine cleavage system protein H [Bacillota bacterium]REJ38398.1 MAG: glycine cleavage system protein GcvH [Bacillota bacterium]